MLPWWVAELLAHAHVHVYVYTNSGRVRYSSFFFEWTLQAMMDHLLLQTFLWHELSSHASSLDIFVLSLTSKATRDFFLAHVMPRATFDVEELACKRAWSVLRHITAGQLQARPELQQVEYVDTRTVRTTLADWAARKGHAELLQWLLAVTWHRCTTFAMDWAARNGHINVLKWLHDHGATCTRAAADWAAVHGHMQILEWLYMHTGSRCSQLAPMYAAGRGDMPMLKQLHLWGVTFTDSTANFAYACGHADVLNFLEAMGCKRSVLEDDMQWLARIRGLAASVHEPFAQWD